MSARADQRVAAPIFRGSGPTPLGAAAPVVRTGAMSQTGPTRREQRFEDRGRERGMKRGLRRGFWLGGLVGVPLGFFVALLAVALHRVFP